MDKYDRQIERLKNNLNLIEQEWNIGIGLFAFTWNKFSSDRTICGCLTQIRGDVMRGVPNRPDLTNKIRLDKRIPRSVKTITVESLPVFAEWQRILDRELGRGD